MGRGILSILLLSGALTLAASPAGAYAPVDPEAVGVLDRATLEAGEILSPERRARVVGDVNGDGRPDVAYTSARPSTARVPAVFIAFGQARGAPLPSDLLQRPGLRIESADLVEHVGPAGDVDGDGYGDVWLQAGGRWSTGSRFAAVVRGGPGGPPVDLAAPDGRGFRFETGGAPSRPAPLGDQDGDGRADLAIGDGEHVWVVFSPASVPGGVLDPRALPGDRVARVHTGAYPEGPLTLAAGDDADGDGDGDLLVGWNERDLGDGRLALVPVPAPGTEADAHAAPGAGGWLLEGGDDEAVLDLTVLSDHNRDGRRDVAIGAAEWAGGTLARSTSRIVLAPARGGTGTLAGTPGYPSRYARLPVDVGDLDGDGRVDFASWDTIQLVTDDLLAGTGWAFGWLLHTGNGIGHYEIGGAVDDRDGDGRRDLLVVRRAQRSPAPDDVMVLSASALPRAQGEEGTVGLHARLASVLLEPERYTPAGLLPALLRPVRLEREGAPPELSATPEYAAGTLRVLVRAPRGSAIEASGAASPWRGTATWTIPAATARPDREHPWLQLAFPLPAEARAALERDGRLKARIGATTTLPGGRIKRDEFSFAVVTTRRAAWTGRRRALRGSFGIQRLLGGAAADLITGASGDDHLRGRGGPDALRGGTGNDRLLGEHGDDALDGDDGDDDLQGGPGNDDLLEGRFGDDRLDGGPGDDVVRSGRGEDTVRGGPGDDVLGGGSGPDVVDCGPGEDIVFVNFTAERNRLTGCEHVYEEPGVVHVPCRDGGTEGPETVLGTEGDDTCEGRAGDDDVEGRGGDDVLLGGGGADRIFGRFGRDRLAGGDGGDELEGGRGRDRLDGGAGNDRLNGGYDPDVVHGGPGDDRIVARGGGRDRIDCGAGTDIAYVDSQDTVVGCERVSRSGAR